MNLRQGVSAVVMVFVVATVTAAQHLSITGEDLQWNPLTDPPLLMTFGVENTTGTSDLLFAWQMGLEIIPDAAASGTLLFSSAMLPSDYLLEGRSGGLTPAFTGPSTVLPVIGDTDSAFTGVAVPTSGKNLLAVAFDVDPGTSGLFYVRAVPDMFNGCAWFSDDFNAREFMNVPFGGGSVVIGSVTVVGTTLDYVWTRGASSHAWKANDNWNQGSSYPDDAGDKAILGSGGLGDGIVDIDGGVTAGNLTFDVGAGVTGYTIRDDSATPGTLALSSILNTSGHNLISAELNVSETVVVSGDTLELTNTQNTLSGTARINGGALVLPTPEDLPSGNLLLDADDPNLSAVVSSAGTFNRAVGTGDNQVQWGESGGGFAAKGGRLEVDLDGPGGGQIVWETALGDRVLQLNHLKADEVVEVLNPINLGGFTRTVLVDENPDVSTDMAVLSGVISGGIAGETRLKKSGDGLLLLTGENIYDSDTEVLAGTLQVAENTALGHADSKLIMHGGATLRSTTWTTGTRTIELIGSSAVTIDAQAGSTAMTLEFEAPTTMTEADVVKKGAGKASFTSGLAMLGDVDVQEGTLALADSLLAFPTGSTVTIADAAILQTSGIVSREVIAGGSGTGMLHATGDTVVGSYATGFDFGGTLKADAGVRIDVIDPDATVANPTPPPRWASVDGANIRSISIGAGGMVTSGGEIVLPNTDYTYAEGATGVLWVDGAATVGGVVFGGTAGGETAYIYGANLDPNIDKVTFTGIRRGNWGSFLVDVTVTGKDDLGFSPVFSPNTNFTFGDVSMVLEGTQQYTPVEDLFPIPTENDGQYTQYLIYGTSLNPGGSGMGTFTADSMITVTLGEGYVPTEGDEFFLVRTDGGLWGHTDSPLGEMDYLDGALLGVDLIDPVNVTVPEGMEWEATENHFRVWVAEGQVIPEPGTLLMLLSGGLALLLARRRRARLLTRPIPPPGRHPR